MQARAFGDQKETKGPFSGTVAECAEWLARQQPSSVRAEQGDLSAEVEVPGTPGAAGYAEAITRALAEEAHGLTVGQRVCGGETEADYGGETVTAAARLRRGQRGEPNNAARSCGCLRGRYDRKAARPVPDGPPCVQCRAKPAKKRSHWCGAACREAYEIRAAAGKVAWLED